MKIRRRQPSKPVLAKTIRRPLVEPLEDRFAPAALVVVSGNDLSVTDGVDADDHITLVLDGLGNLQISDPNGLTAGAGAVQNDPNTVTVTLGTFTSISLLGNGGDDVFTLDFSSGNLLPSGGLSVSGGTDSGAGDSLILTGGNTTLVDHAQTSSGTGSITLSGALAGSISYDTLEPITDDLVAADRAFTFNGGAETITLSGTTASTSTIVSTLGQPVTFAHPSGSLAIHGGSGDDVIHIDSIGSSFGASLTVTGDGGTSNSVTLAAGLPTLASVDVNAQSITLHTLTTIGAHTYTGAVTLGSNTVLTATASPISFSGPIDGAFDLTVNTSGTTTFGGTIGASSALTSLTTDAAGTTALQGGAITTSGAAGISFGDSIILGVNTLLSAGSGAITLGSTVDGAFALAAHTTGLTTFGGVIGGTSALASLSTDAGGGTVISGNVTTTGTQTFSDAVTLAAATQLTSSGSGDITLDSTLDGAFDLIVNTAGAITLGGTIGGSVALHHLTLVGGSLGAALPTLSLTGNFSSTTTGSNVTQSGAWTIGGTTTISAGAHTITLNSANDFTGAVTLTNTGSNNVSIADANAIVLGASTIGGTLAVTASGAITQSGALVVAGAATFDAGTTNDITLTNASNNFSSLGITTGHDVSVTDVNALILGASTVSGNLSVNTTGAITQSGALIITGTTTLAAGTANDITLNTGTNNFSTLAITSGNHVGITDTDAIVFGASTITGNLSVATSGAITQFGALAVAGTSSLTAGANAITLTTASNDFTGAVSLSNSGANAVQITDTNALVLGTVNVGNNLIVTASGPVTQTGIITATGGTTTIAAGSGNNITLNGANDFATLAITSGNNVSVTDANSLVLGAFTVSGTLGVNTSGAITQSGALVVTGAATFAAGAANDITLNNASNNFSTAAFTTGNNVSVTDLNALILGASTVSGTLGANTSGAITQSGALVVTGTTTLAAGSGNNITLNSANDFSTLVVTSGNNVSVTDTNAIILGASTVSGTLGVTTSGTITQSGALVVTGAATFAAGAANDITLNNASNNFSAAAFTTGNNVSVTDLNALILGASTVSGTFGVNTSGAITQSGALIVTGTTTLAAGSANDITLNTGTNNFSTLIVTSGNNVGVTDTNGIILGASTVGGTLGVTTSGAITQSGALTVAGTSSFTAGANAITLTAASNDFTGAVSLSNSGANAVQITDTNALVLGTVNVGNHLTVTASSAVTQTGTITATAGTTTIAAGSGNNITLNSANDFATLAISSGNNVSVTDANALILGASTVSGTFGVNTSGAITQSGALAVSGTTTLAAGTGNNITLNNANDFATLVITSGNNVSITDSNALILGASTVNGTLGVNTTGAITQSGALVVTGAATFAAGGANDITLNNASNNFSNAAFTTGNNVSVTDLNALILGASTVSGNLTVNTTGAITQSGALAVTGTSSFTVGANAITLTTATNDFTGAVSLSNSGANAVQITDTNAIVLGTVNVGNNLIVTASGTITQTGTITATGGTTTLAAGAANNITLNSANDFATLVITSGKDVSVTDANALILGASTVNGTLGVTTSGAITQSGALVVTGAATFAAGGANDITLNNASNNFSNASFTSGNNVSVTDLNALILGASTVSGNLAVNTTGAITQSSALAVTGTSSFTAGANAITLTTATNDFTGAVSLSNSGANAVQITDTNALVLGTVSVGNNLTVTTSGAVTQTGTITATGGTTTIAAGSGNNITLNSANDFTTLVITSGNNVSVTDSNALILGASTVSGTLGVNTTGAITQSGALVVTGTTTLAAGSGNNITLNSANDFSTLVITSGNNVSVTDTNVIILGASTVSGNLTVNTTGAITQSGALAVTGTSSFSAGANAITLTSATNDFTGAVSLSNSGANAVQITDTNALVLGTVNVGNNLIVTASGAVTQTGTITATGGATTIAAGASNNITLNNANDFATLVITSGNNVSVTDSNAIILGASTISGNLTVNTTGAITQSGALAVTGTSSFTAGANAITLTTATNDFNGAVSLSNSGANAVQITDTNALVLGTVSVGNNLTVTASGAVTQTGAITATGGITTIAAGSGNNITLNSANDFATLVITSGNNVSVTDANALILGASTVSGNFGITTSGALTQSGVLTVAGTTTLAAGSGNNITLNNAANDFATLAVTSGNNVSITDVNTLILGASTISGTLGVNTSGTITQSGALVVAGTTTLAAGSANDITLNTGGNNFSTVVITSGNNVAVTDTNALILGASTVSGNLTVNTAGNITQSGALSVAGTSSFAAGNGAVTLTTATNDFTGAVSLSNSGANNVSIRDTNAIILGTSSVGTGTLTITANGITQTGTVTQAAGAGDATLSGGTGAINLALANDFASITATTTGAGAAITVNDTNALSVTTATTTDGAISLSGGSLSLINTVSAGNGGLITLTATGNVSLSNVTTTGNVSITAGSISETVSDGGNDITANTLTINSGAVGAPADPIEIAVTSLNATVTGAGNSLNLTDTAGGLLVTSATTTDGAINLAAVGGNLTLTSVNAGGTGRNITLTTTTSGNVILDSVTAAGNTVTISSAGTIEESGSDAGAEVTAGSLIVSTGTTFGASGTIETAVSNFAASTTGNIDLANTGALNISGAVTSSAGSIVINTGTSGLTTTAAITAASGNTVTLTADAIALGASVSGPAGVTLKTTTATAAMSVGGSAAFDLSDAELDFVTGSLITIGEISHTGGISIGTSGALTQGAKNFTFLTGTNIAVGGSNFTTTGNVTLTADADTNSTGAITTGAGVVGASSLTATAANGIALNTSVNTLNAFNSTSGNISIAEANGITVAALTTLAGNGNIALTTTAGSIATIGALSAHGTGDISLTAGGAGSTIGLGANVTGDAVTLSATGGAISQTAGRIAAALLTANSGGNQTLTSTTNNIAAFIATNTAAGSSINLENGHDGFTIGAVSTNSGAIVIDNTNGGASDDATINGLINSGGGAAGDVTISTTGHMDVNGVIKTTDSGGSGSGGTLVLDGWITVNASPSLGAGNIELHAGTAGDLVIDADITLNTSYTLTSARNVVFGAKVIANGSTSDLTIRADSDNDGQGGVWVQAGGYVSAGRDLSIAGSALTNELGLPTNEAVRISGDGTQTQVQAVRNLTIGANASYATNHVALGGDVRSTNTGSTIGNIAFTSPVEIVEDTASVYAGASGSITFEDTLYGTHDLQLQSVFGNINFDGAVGGTAALVDLTIVNAYNVTSSSTINANSLVITNALATVNLGGIVTTAATTGDSFYVHAPTLNLTGSDATGGGQVLWEVDNLAFTSNVSGDGTLTIRPITASRSIGIASATGSLNLSATEVNLLDDGFSSITIGRPNGTGVITVGGATFKDALNILTPGGTLTIEGTLATTGIASDVDLQAKTINLNVNRGVTDTPVISTQGADLRMVNTNVILLADAFISTSTGSLGGNVTLTASINGARGFEIDALNSANGGVVLLNGLPSPANNSSFGGTTRLTSFEVSGNTIFTSPNTLVKGPITYHATTSLVTHGGVMDTSRLGAVTIDAPLLATANLRITSADVNFLDTVDNRSSTDLGALTIDATGSVTFAGVVGGTQPLKSVSIQSVGTTSIQEAFQVTGGISIAATEIDLPTSADTVFGSSIILQPLTNLQNVTVGVASETLNSSTLELSQSDIAALGDGFSLITLGRATQTSLFNIVGPLTFSDPVLFQSSSLAMNIGGIVTGTDNASLSFKSNSLNVNADLAVGSGNLLLKALKGRKDINLAAGVDISSNGGSITFDGFTYTHSDLAIDTAGGNLTFVGATYLLGDLDINSHGGAVTFRTTVLSPASTGANLTIDADDGAIDFLGGIGNGKAVNRLNAITLNTTGVAHLHSIDAASLVTNAGGATHLLGNITTYGSLGIEFNDDVLLAANVILSSTFTSADISFHGKVETPATRVWSLTAKTVNGDITFDKQIGATGAVLNLTATSKGGDVTLHDEAYLSTASIQGGLVTTEKLVSSTKSQIYTARDLLSLDQLIVGTTLSANSAHNIVNTDGWVVTGRASIKSTSKLSTEGIAVDGTGNSFDGGLVITAHLAEIVTDGDLLIAGGNISRAGVYGGIAHLTSLHGDILQTGAFSTWRLEASAPEGEINFGLGNFAVTLLGDISADGNIVIIRGGTLNLTLMADIVSADGEVILVANNGTSKANFQNVSFDNTISATRFLIYSYDESVSASLLRGISATHQLNHRYPELFPGSNLIYVRA